MRDTSEEMVEHLEVHVLEPQGTESAKPLPRLLGGSAGETLKQQRSWQAEDILEKERGGGQPQQQQPCRQQKPPQSLAGDAPCEYNARTKFSEAADVEAECIATAAEQRRFLKACKGDIVATEKMLGDYLAWRAKYLPLALGVPALGRELPDFARLIGYDLESQKVLLLLGAMYDDKIAPADAYALALAAVLDQSIDRHSDEAITVLIDTRADPGWANPRPWGIVSLVRALNKMLRVNFPGRFARVVVFPVPWIAAKIWQSANPLDKDSASSVVMVEGADRHDSPAPERLRSFLDADTFEAIGRYRAARSQARGAH